MNSENQPASGWDWTATTRAGNPLLGRIYEPEDLNAVLNYLQTQPWIQEIKFTRFQATPTRAITPDQLLEELCSASEAQLRKIKG
jgi:hypothetical protein